MKLIDDIFETLKLRTTIYHYTSSKIALEKILPYDSILMNHLKNTNDPREYKDYNLYSSGWGNSDNEDYNKINLTIRRLDEIRKNEFQILSFSCNKKELYENTFSSIISQVGLLGCCKPRMWVQYGDNYQGVVLAFNSEILIDSIKSQLKAGDIFFAQNINYEAFDLKSEQYLNWNQILKENVDDYCISFLVRQKDYVFYNKNPDFQNEDEFRIILRSIHSNRIPFSIKDSLIAVLIGDRFPDGLLPSLIFFCNQLNVNFKRINWDGGRAEIFDCLPLDPCLLEKWNLDEEK